MIFRGIRMILITIRTIFEEIRMIPLLKAAKKEVTLG